MTKAPAQVLHSTKHQFLEVVSPQFQYAITNKLQLGVIMKSHRLCSRATKLWSSKLPAGEVVSQISSREFEHPAIHISILCAWCMYIDLSIDLSLSLRISISHWIPIYTSSSSTLYDETASSPGHSFKNLPCFDILLLLGLVAGSLW